ncbi:hypothetical protein SAMN05428961_11062 [Paenibacillus sp. OK060]|uniref:hypothetical protein n=1 Tax=Paenibacillus sp. OK060 TaxID=1881034 RepID=UPI000884E880|nr:hypothetical protein [Paenibacillus sp. OK060]SDM14824.1 hypothetical protein SAMN05428961_11062 [Paenibacillus sp. OK060]
MDPISRRPQEVQDQVERDIQSTSSQSVIAIQDTMYYLRAEKLIPGIHIPIRIKIDAFDLGFWKRMILDRVTCAKEWLRSSDNYDSQESDLSIFSTIYGELTIQDINGPSNDLYLNKSLYIIHSIIAALEIESHVMMYDGNKKGYQTARKYSELITEATQPYQSVLNKIDQVLYGKIRDR